MRSNRHAHLSVIGGLCVKMHSTWHIDFLCPIRDLQALSRSWRIGLVLLSMLRICMSLTPAKAA